MLHNRKGVILWAFIGSLLLWSSNAQGEYIQSCMMAMWIE